MNLSAEKVFKYHMQSEGKFLEESFPRFEVPTLLLLRGIAGAEGNCLSYHLLSSLHPLVDRLITGLRSRGPVS
jgi:hypothetical protein